MKRFKKFVWILCLCIAGCSLIACGNSKSKEKQISENKVQKEPLTIKPVRVDKKQKIGAYVSYTIYETRDRLVFASSNNTIFIYDKLKKKIVDSFQIIAGIQIAPITGQGDGTRINPGIFAKRSGPDIYLSRKGRYYCYRINDKQLYEIKATPELKKIAKDSEKFYEKYEDAWEGKYVEHPITEWKYTSVLDGKVYYPLK